jgi:hypothetical protein
MNTRRLRPLCLSVEMCCCRSVGFLLSSRVLKIHIGTKRPNLLFVMSDEHNMGVRGRYGNGTVRNPSMDALVRWGGSVALERCNYLLPSSDYYPSRLHILSEAVCEPLLAMTKNCLGSTYHPLDGYTFFHMEACKNLQIRKLHTFCTVTSEISNNP